MAAGMDLHTKRTGALRDLTSDMAVTDDPECLSEQFAMHRSEKVGPMPLSATQIGL